MTISTVTVSIAVAQITGAALPNARVRFELTAPDIDSGIVAPKYAPVTLDEDGEGSIALWSNSSGTQGTRYRVTIHDANGDLQFGGFATIPDSDCNLHDVLNLIAPDSVDDAEAAALAAQGYASDAATSASAAATAVSAHVNDASGAHAASAISFSPPVGMTSTNAQDAIAEAFSNGGGGGGGSATWGGIGGTLSNQTDLAAALAAKADSSAVPTAHSQLSGVGSNTHAQIDTALTRLANTSGTNTGDQDLSTYATTAAVAAGYQPLDSDLSAIAALFTTPYGRALLALADAAALRTAAGLGTLATQSGTFSGTSSGTNTGDQDLSGYATAAAVAAAYQPLDADLTAIAALTTTTYGRAFLALADAAAGRTALGLGTAATTAASAYEVAGAAAAAQAASQPLDSDLTAIAALTTTTFGRALLALADAAALRTAAGLVAVASSGSASDLSAGTLAAARGGAGTVNGIMVANGSGAVSAAVSGTDLKTINSTSIIGSGNITVSAAPGGSSGAVQGNDSSSFAGIPSFTFNTTTGALTHAIGTITADTPALNITQTWNNSGVTFTGFKINVTPTAAATASLLADFQASGASQFAFRKDGRLTIPSGGSITINGTRGYQSANGSAVNPNLVSTSAGDTGVWVNTSGGNQVGFSGGGTEMGSVTASGLSAAGYVKPGVKTVGTLPSASTAGHGACFAVSDLSSLTNGSTATGGGSIKGFVVSNNSAWIVLG